MLLSLQSNIRPFTSLDQIIFILCSGIFVITFGLTILLIINHRKGLGQHKVHFHKSVYVELIWGVVPFLIILCLAYPMIWTLFAK